MSATTYLRAIINGMRIDPSTDCVYCGNSSPPIDYFTGQQVAIEEGEFCRCDRCGNITRCRNGIYRPMTFADIAYLKNKLESGNFDATAMKAEDDEYRRRICPND